MSKMGPFSDGENHAIWLDFNPEDNDAERVSEAGIVDQDVLVRARARVVTDECIDW